jgi:hypothetical protein
MYAGNLAVVAENDSNGCLAMWSGCTEVETSTLEALAKSAGLTPPDIGPKTVLSRALTALAGKDEIVVTVTPITMALVRKVPLGEPTPDRDVDYVERVRVAIEPDGQFLALLGGVPGLFTEIAHVRTHRNATDVSNMLGQAIRVFQGVPLRDRGGVYIVPQARIAAWQTFADAVTAAGAAHCHSVPVAYGERFTRLAVESIRTHVANTLADIRDAVETGNLGARALKGLLTHDTTSLESQIDAYGDLLGGVGAELKQASEDARQLIEAALIIAEAKKGSRK